MERVVVHDLNRARRLIEWALEEPFTHMALSGDGRYLRGAGLSNRLWVLDARSARVEAVVELPGFPQYILPVVFP
jgi:hypothetical protein